MPENHVISLTTAQQRRNHIRRQFEGQNIPFRFFDAVTPDTLNEAASKLLPALSDAKQLSPGEKACFMSQISLWQHCIDQNLPYIGIFEDDIWLGRQAADFLADDAWLAESFREGEPFVLRLETFYEPCRIKTSGKKGYLNRQIADLCSAHYGAGAYLISQTAARRLLARLRATPADDLSAVDAMLFDDWMYASDWRIYQLTPAVCIQESVLHPEQPELGSQLEDGRRQKPRHKARRTLPQKLHREIRRLYRQFRRWQSRSLPEQTVPFE